MVTGKNIVVTGCLHGIGKETLRVLAKHGASVFACARKRTKKFELFCKKLSDSNKVSIWPIYFDITDSRATKGAVRLIAAQKIEIHGLVNAIEIDRDASFGTVTYQNMLAAFQVNFISQIVFSQYIADIMQRKKTSASIAFTSSIGAMDGDDAQFSYSASKAALIGATKTMALELGKLGIRVNAVAPGFLRTPMMEIYRKTTMDKKIKMMDIPRFGEVEEVANAFMFLMSDLSSHMSGQTIRVDGGIG